VGGVPRTALCFPRMRHLAQVGADLGLIRFPLFSLLFM
jgi:hypothetical protein